MDIVRAIVMKARRLNNLCNHNEVLAKVLMPAKAVWRGLGIGRYLTKIMNDNDPKYQEIVRNRQEALQKFYGSHKQELERVYNMLEDDLSRHTMKTVAECRQTGNVSKLKEICVQPQYFQKDILSPVKDEVFVDGGAYVGDTVESFLQNFAGGYRKIYVWEPDEANMATMKKKLKRLRDIVYVPCGMWDKETELMFIGNGGTDARLIDAGSQVTVGTDSEVATRIKVNSIDNVCAGDKVTFIKMDIEGSELAALKGAVNVIKRDKPRLAICIYHKPEDLYEIPLWIKETVPEYKLYMRHHTDTMNETVLYATL